MELLLKVSATMKDRDHVLCVLSFWEVQFTYSLSLKYRGLVVR